ncbi:MAG: endonuclease domain-containing protein [Variibacter sp.]
MAEARQGRNLPLKGGGRSRSDREGVVLKSRFSKTREMTTRARDLRRDLTRAERKLWYALQRGQINGFGFRRQHPVGPFVLDFYCPAARLAIELDGGQHNELTRKHDERRGRWLAAKHITVLRFWNNEVLSNLEGVLTVIASALVTHVTPTRTASPSDLPLLGGGLRGASHD